MKKAIFTAAAAMCLGVTLGMTACSSAAGSNAKANDSVSVSVQTEAADKQGTDKQKSDGQQNTAGQEGHNRTSDNQATADVKESTVEVTMDAAQKSSGSQQASSVTAQKLSNDDTEVICGADPSTWSPFTDCKNLKEAEDVAGFDISVPEKIDGYNDISYAAMERYKLIQIDYKKDENRYICIRKSLGNEDISGDYNVYKEETKTDIDDRLVNFKGNDGKVSLATWTDGDYAYSVMYADLTEDVNSLKTAGVSSEQMKELVSKIK